MFARKSRVNVVRPMNLYSNDENSLIADYVSRMGEAIIRRDADLEVRSARMEAELSIQAHAEFLANMNHELRTPLNAIIGFATILNQEEEYQIDVGKRKGYAEYILQSAELLLGHIDTLLEVAALESGELSVSNEAVELGALLDAALTRVEKRAQQAGVSIERRDDGQLISAWGDPERIGQAIDHLIRSALNSCDGSGKIFVRASYDDAGLPEVAVRDDGRGYTADEIREALNAFSEPLKGLERKFTGPGLGFSIAKTFIEMQSGKFSIKSRTGKGTLVRMALPLTSAAAQSLPEMESRDAPPVKPTEIELERPNDAA